MALGRLGGFECLLFIADLRAKFSFRCATSKNRRPVKLVLGVLEWQLSGQCTKIQSADCLASDTYIIVTLCQKPPISKSSFGIGGSYNLYDGE